MTNTDASVWSTGGVAAAVSAVRAAGSLLVVLTCAPGSAASDADAVLARLSTQWLLETTFADSAVRIALQAARATCIRLDGSAADPDFRNFSALFPVMHVPALHIIAPDGRVLVQAAFYVSPRALVRAIGFALRARRDPALPPPDLGPTLHPRRPLPQRPQTATRKAAKPAAKPAARQAAKPAPREAAKPTAKPPGKPAPVQRSRAGAPGAPPPPPEVRDAPSAAGALQLGPTRARLAARLPGGGMAQRAFARDAAFLEVVDWTAEELGCRRDEVRLSVAFPRRVFDAADQAKTVEELGLFPSASLIAAREAAPAAGAGVLARVASGGGAIRDAVGVAGSFFASFVSGGPPRDGDEQADNQGAGPR